MRGKIIQYLQNIECEWFPVEWDPYFTEWLATEIECYDISGIKMRYSFEEKDCNVQYVRDMDGENIKFSHFSHYGTVDRCKLLLLNAVRSVDEPKRKDVFFYHIDDTYRPFRVFVAIKKGINMEYMDVWKNGKFK